MCYFDEVNSNSKMCGVSVLRMSGKASKVPATKRRLPTPKPKRTPQKFARYSHSRGRPQHELVLTLEVMRKVKALDTV